MSIHQDYQATNSEPSSLSQFPAATPLRLSDELIGQIAKLVQLAMLTGTSVVDQIRGMQVEADASTGEVTLHKDYVEGFNGYLQSLLEQAEALAEEFATSSKESATDLDLN